MSEHVHPSIASCVNLANFYRSNHKNHNTPFCSTGHNNMSATISLILLNQVPQVRYLLHNTSYYCPIKEKQDILTTYASLAYNSTFSDAKGSGLVVHKTFNPWPPIPIPNIPSTKLERHKREYDIVYWLQVLPTSFLLVRQSFRCLQEQVGLSFVREIGSKGH